MNERSVLGVRQRNWWVSCMNALVWRAREFSRAATYHSRGLAAFVRSSPTETKQSRAKSRQPRKCYISGVVGATLRMAHIHYLLFGLVQPEQAGFFIQSIVTSLSFSYVFGL